jgi:excinuclease ABC subunit A
VIDRLVIKSGIESRLAEFWSWLRKLSEGMVKIDLIEEKEHSCSLSQCLFKCNIGYEELAPQHFSFNSPLALALLVMAWDIN